jgi:lysophospholipid acyltransferase (LPLAT)-like uncharacterized protein
MDGGVPHLARASGAPVLLVGLASRPCLRLNSWDAAILPLPFARGAIAWARLEPVRRDTDPASLGAMNQEWTLRLRALTRRAEELVA